MLSEDGYESESDTKSPKYCQKRSFSLGERNKTESHQSNDEVRDTASLRKQKLKRKSRLKNNKINLDNLSYFGSSQAELRTITHCHNTTSCSESERIATSATNTPKGNLTSRSSSPPTTTPTPTNSAVNNHNNHSSYNFGDVSFTSFF
eukprot:UN34541